MNGRTRLKAAALFSALLGTQEIALLGQNSEPSAGAAPAPQGTATQAPVPSLVHQEELTGDWGGLRTQWKDNGVVLDSSLTQFYQGVASGGTETGSEYNGIAQVKLESDFEKLTGWQHWTGEVKAELRFGGPLLGGTGTINPVNTAAIIPGADGTKFSMTAVNLTRVFPIDTNERKLVAVSFGRFNTVDLLDEHFFAGDGTERFLNVAQTGPLTVLRQVPLITNAISLAYLRGGEPFITFSLMDPNDQSLDPGLSDLFADGVTFYPDINVPTKYWGKSAKHSFGFAVTTKQYTPFDAIRQVIIPGPPLDPVEPRAGSWSVNYMFRQYMVERAKDDGWGIFSQISFADRATSPVTTFFDIGLGGNGILEARPHDVFGVAYAFTDLSKDLEDNVNLLTPGSRPVRAEHQLEVFYNLHIVPWIQLTGDLQIVRPTLSRADTAIVPGVRLRIVF